MANIPFFDRLQNALWRASRGAGTENDPCVPIVEVRSDPTDPLEVSIGSLPLPPGASTSALQTAGNTSLASLNSKAPPLGQAPASASVPVVLPAAQVTALTPFATVGVNNFPSTQAISATTLPLPSGAATEGTLSTLVERVKPSGVFLGSVNTSTTGADFVTLPSNSASSVLLYNRTGVSIDWRYVGVSSAFVTLQDQVDEVIPVVENSNTLQVRRTDNANTPVTITFRGVL